MYWRHDETCVPSTRRSTRREEHWGHQSPVLISNVRNIRGLVELLTSFLLEDLLRIKSSAEAREAGRDAG